MDILKIDLQYFANIIWYKKAIQYKYIEFPESDRHVKMGFRNRIWLTGADGRLSLSIPLIASRNEMQLYKDVRIAPGRWSVGHFRTITSCYNRSPWFEHYRDELAVLFGTRYQFLWDWNMACFDWVNQQLAASIDIHPPGGTRKVNVVDARNVFRPANYADWVAGENGRYAQVFEDRVGFIPGLSILDLIFCEGPAARKWLGQI